MIFLYFLNKTLMAESYAYPTEDPFIHAKIAKVIPTLEILEEKIESKKPESYLLGFDTAHLFFYSSFRKMELMMRYS